MMRALSKRIVEGRHARGLSRQQLADQVGVSEQYLSRIERGVSLPSLGKLIKVADVLKVTVDQLIEIDHTHKPPVPSVDAERSPKIVNLAKRIVDQGPGAVRVIVKLIKLSERRFDGTDTA